MSDPVSHPLKTVVESTLAPPPMPGIFSQAIISGNTVYCSGSLGIDPQTNKLVGPSISERTTQALENLKNVLEAAGSGFDKIVKTTIYITNMEEYAAVNKAYAKAFRGTVVPARTCVAVYQLPLRSDVEIECIAHLKWGIETHPPLTFALGGAYSANPSPEPEQRSVEGEAISAGAEKGPSEPLVRNRLAGDW